MATLASLTVGVGPASAQGGSSAQGGVKELIARTSALEEQVGSLRGDLSALASHHENDLSQARRELQQLEAALETERAERQQQDGAILSRVEELRNLQESTQQQVADLQLDFDSVARSIESLQDTVAKALGRLEEAETDIGSLRDDTAVLRRLELARLELRAVEIGRAERAQMQSFQGELGSILTSLVAFPEVIKIPTPVGGTVPVPFPKVVVRDEQLVAIAQSALEAVDELRCGFGLVPCTDTPAISLTTPWARTVYSSVVSGIVGALLQFANRNLDVVERRQVQLAELVGWLEETWRDWDRTISAVQTAIVEDTAQRIEEIKRSSGPVQAAATEELQHQLDNAERAVQVISNVSKSHSETSKSIVRNLRG